MKKTSFPRYLPLTALLVSAGLMPVAGAAEPQPEPIEEMDSIEEVVVTARKRDERLSEVPSSVSVLSESDTEKLVLDDMGDYLRQLPSATLVSGGPDYLRDISIRGQGGGRLGFSESATGIYRNGMYVAGGGFGGRSLSRMDFFDMDTLQVYSGPQGALYGRNAVGGAVNAVSHRPTDEFEGNVKLGNGYNNQTGSAVVNTPVNDQLAFRMGAYWEDKDKGQTTLKDTGEYTDLSDYNGVRASMAWAPTDTLSVAVTAEQSSSTAPSFSALGYRSNTAASIGGAPQDPDPFTLDRSVLAQANIDETSMFVEMDWESELFDVHAGFNSRDRQGEGTGDHSGFIGYPYLPYVHPQAGLMYLDVDITSVQTEDFNRMGGDVYLASNGDSPLQWLAGAEYQTFTSDVKKHNEGIAPGGLGGQLRTDDSSEEMHSVAVFGSVDYALTEQLTLSVEGRVQQDEKTYDFVRTADATVPVANAAEAIDQQLERSWSESLFGSSLSYQLSEDHMVFARVSSGYRPGGFNNGVPDSVANATDYIPYEPEFVRSTELGWKGPMLGGLLQGSFSVYNSHTDDVQTVIAPDPVNTTLYVLDNAGDHEIWGAEFEARGRYKLDFGGLAYSVGLSSNRGDWKNGTMVRDGIPSDLTGLRVNRTRDLIANLNLSYVFPVAHLQAFVSGSYQTEAGGFESADHVAELSEFELFDLRASISGAQWEASLYGKNLMDEVYVTQTIASNEFFSQGRTWGGSLSYHF